MDVVILAAGMGSRMGTLTDDKPKCLVEVNGVPILTRLLTQLWHVTDHVNKIIIGVGYRADDIKQFVGDTWQGIPVVYVENKDYETTNNIWSLGLILPEITDDFVLFEGDLLLSDDAVSRMVTSKNKDCALVKRWESYMDGTVVSLDDTNSTITDIIPPWRQTSSMDLQEYYKTINVYTISYETLTSCFKPMLDTYLQVLPTDRYYEEVIGVLVYTGARKIEAVITEDDCYEIDNQNDLAIASYMFGSCEDQLNIINSRHGGHWELADLVDHRYIVNPFFPTKELINSLKLSSENLIRNYPPTSTVIESTLSRLINVEPTEIVVGNGASELIKIITDSLLPLKTLIEVPTFGEYTKSHSRTYLTKKQILQYPNFNKQMAVVLSSPNNPMGYSWELDELRLLRNKVGSLYIDTSFEDFDLDRAGQSMTLYNESDNVTLIKSLGKSYGVPGIRLGYVISKEEKLVQILRKYLPIWNVSSHAHEFLTILPKYTKQYESSLRVIKENRDEMYNDLSNMLNLTPYPSNANFITCNVDNCINLDTMERELFEEDILIKRIENVKGLRGQHIRLAVRTREENKKLLDIINWSMYSKPFKGESFV